MTFHSLDKTSKSHHSSRSNLVIYACVGSIDNVTSVFSKLFGFPKHDSLRLIGSLFPNIQSFDVARHAFQTA